MNRAIHSSFIFLLNVLRRWSRFSQPHLSTSIPTNAFQLFWWSKRSNESRERNKNVIQIHSWIEECLEESKEWMRIISVSAREKLWWLCKYFFSVHRHFEFNHRNAFTKLGIKISSHIRVVCVSFVRALLVALTAKMRIN